MTAKYYAILTNQGAAKLAAATAQGTRLNITRMAVGDGNGTLPSPNATQTSLVNQKRIGALNVLMVDSINSNQIIAEQIIPENEGGFWIREMGLYDDAGVLVAVANCPETYKPQLDEGSGRTQTIRMVLTISNTSAITLKVDATVALASRQYVDDQLSDHIKASNPHSQYLQISQSLKEIADSGPAAVAAAVKNLGIEALISALLPKASFTQSDYIRIPDKPGGLIIQWGNVMSNASGDATWTHPTPFPNQRLGVWGTFKRLGVAGTDYPTISFNNVSDPDPRVMTNFHLRINGTPGVYGAFTFALGY
ncbi:Phage tail-collar fibre protein [Kosakonia oryzendophytica]|uniref:Phage tail-collar fibre protein n=1 Tax=Kosakonia oryzendophytica TaxID=1005665 RepID=A0A1C4DJ79_9ENTR|nr:phage tail protein [Kosakonia oryzendophytica]SCC31335.1 Phage tail-collar fibre protein [Kosakonia oryzendophytica]